MSAPPRPAPERPTAAPNERIWVLTVPYEERAVAQSHGARYITGYGWVFTGAELPRALSDWVPRRYSWDEWLADDLSGRAPKGPQPAPTTDTGSITLRPDQEADAQLIQYARASGAPEFVLASDVGVGKTPTTIAAINAMARVQNVLVVCPHPQMAGWRDHLHRMGDGGKRWCIINYESTKKLLTIPAAAQSAKKQRTRNLRIARSGKSRVHWDVLVADEAHACQNPEAQQTMVLDRLVDTSTERPTFALRLSATIGADPSKVSYLHRGLAWRTGRPVRSHITSDEYVAWCEEYGFQVSRDGFGNRLKWAPNGADLKKMHTLLFKGAPAWGIRRRPAWGEAPRIPVPIEITPRERVAYETEWRAFATAMDELKKAREAASQPGATAAVKRAAAAAKDRGWAAQTRYQQKVGVIKASGNADFAKTLLDRDMQVAISCRFHGAVEAIQERMVSMGIQPAIFTGNNIETREDERLAFQRGEKRVIIFTTSSAINLHASDTGVQGASSAQRGMIIAEPRWSPDPALQVEGRCNRDGQIAPVFYGYAEGTIDERVITRSVEGMLNTKRMLGDSTDGLTDLAAALGVPTVLKD